MTHDEAVGMVKNAFGPTRPLLTKRDVNEFLGYTETRRGKTYNAVEKLIREGHLEAVKLPSGVVRITASSLVDYITTKIEEVAV